MHCKRVTQQTVRCLGEKPSVVECKCISVRMDVSTRMNMAANGSTNKINDKTFD